MLVHLERARKREEDAAAAAAEAAALEARPAWQKRLPPKPVVETPEEIARKRAEEEVGLPLLSPAVALRVCFPWPSAAFAMLLFVLLGVGGGAVQQPATRQTRGCSGLAQTLTQLY